jgi:hypothetical protein
LVSSGEDFEIHDDNSLRIPENLVAELIRALGMAAAALVESSLLII